MRVLKILAGAALAAATLHVGSASAAPTEAAVLARIERFCADPSPKAVAAEVARNGHAETDPEGLALEARSLPGGAKHGETHAWTLHEADTWWLRTGVAYFPAGMMTECTLRVADLREAEMERLLRTTPQWRFVGETMGGPNDNTWIREYHAKTGGKMLLYTTTMIGPASVRRFHSFSVMGGPAVAKRAGQ